MRSAEEIVQTQEIYFESNQNRASKSSTGPTISTELCHTENKIYISSQNLDSVTKRGRKQTSITFEEKLKNFVVGIEDSINSAFAESIKSTKTATKVSEPISSR